MMTALSLSPGAIQMPQCVLNCQHCHKPVTHGEINLASLASYDPLWAPKPDFSEAGLRMMCSNCKKPSTYQRYELMYTHDQHAAKPYVRDLHPPESQKSQIVSLTWKEFVEKLSELDMKRNEGKPKRRGWKHVFTVSG
jgi:hypothetical protein